MEVVKKSLNQILAELDALQTQLEEQEGLFEDSQLEELAISEEELELKLKAYRFRCKQLEAKRTLLKDETKRLQSRGKSLDAVVDRLKENMLTALLMFGEDTKTETKRLKYDDVTFFTTNREVLAGDVDKFLVFMTSVLEFIFENPTSIEKVEDIKTVVITKLNDTYAIKLPTVEQVDAICSILNYSFVLEVSILDFVNKPYLKELLNGTTVYSFTPTLNTKETINFINTHSNIESVIPEVAVKIKPTLNSR